MTDNKNIKVIEVADAFSPHDRVTTELPWSAERTLADYFGDETRPPVIAVNGRVVPAEQHGQTYLQAGDCVVVTPMVAGGGGGSTAKRVLRGIAIGAIAYFGFGAGFWMSALIGINGATLFGHKKKSASTDPATYGVNGALNTSEEGVACPVVYGTFRYGGNIIENYTENYGNSQFVYLLLNAGEGPVANITDILINDEVPEHFVGPDPNAPAGSTPPNILAVSTNIKLGTADQMPLQWFANSMTPLMVDTNLSTAWSYATTQDIVDQVRIDLVAGGGLYHVDSKGNYSAVSVAIEIEYAPVGSSVWTPLPVATDAAVVKSAPTYSGQLKWSDALQSFNLTPYVPDGSETTDGTYVHDKSGAIVGVVQSILDVNTSAHVMTANSRNAYYLSWRSGALTEGKYQIRVRRSAAEAFTTDPDTVDRVTWQSLTEIVTTPVAYRNTALVAVRVLLNSVLSGIPKVTFLSHGKLIPVWDSTGNTWVMQASSNPAWITMDILRNDRYGGGAPLSRFNLDRWLEWASYCDAKGLQFNGALDKTSTVWDSATAVAQVGHASLMLSGTKYTMVIERASDPVMMFSVANIIKGSFSESWASLADRANVFEGTYYDAADNYRQRTIRTYEKTLLSQGAAEKTSQVKLEGVTSADQAWAEINLMLAANRYIRQSVKFSAPIESIACEVGDVVLVQHDLPQWGQGGRTAMGSTTTTVNLDRTVTMQYGTVYQVLVHMPVVQRATGMIGGVLNTSLYTQLTLFGYDGSAVKRIVVNGVEYAVSSSFQSGPNFGVNIAPTTAITSGQTYAVYAQDAIDTRQVVNPASAGAPVTTSQLTVVSPLSAAPADFANWMFGPVNQSNKPFRISAISGTHEYEREISAIEYNETIYSNAGAAPTPNYSTLGLTVTQATISGVNETVQSSGATFLSTVAIAFTCADPTYSGSRVYIARNGGAFTYAGSDYREVKVTAGQGESLLFKVVAYNGAGVSASYAIAPTTSYTTLGKTTSPTNMSGLTANITAKGIELDWVAPTDADWGTSVLRVGGVPIFEGKGTHYTWPFQAAGTYTVVGTNKNANKESAATVSAVVNITAPNVPAVTVASVSGPSAHFTWTSSLTSVPLDYYEIRVGGASDTAATASFYSKVSGNTQQLTYVDTGPNARKIFVIAHDLAGNVSAAGSAAFTTTLVADQTLPVATAVQGYNGQVKKVTLTGRQDTFYPVVIQTQAIGGAVYYDVVVSRPQVHEDTVNGTDWLCSYSCHVYARATSYGNADAKIIEVIQSTGSGTYTSGVSSVYPALSSNGIILMLRGGMTHTVSMSQPIGAYTVTPYMTGFSDPVAGNVTSETTGTLLSYLNHSYCPGATLDWGSSVGGITRPQDNATVGAPSGTPVGNTTADALVTQAATAASQAATALGLLSSITADNVLSPGEKPTVIQDKAVIDAEYPNLLAQANALGATSQRDAWNNSITDLNNYLASLSTPKAWNDQSGDTNIDGPTLRAKFAAVYAAKQALIDTMLAIAATTASWAGVSGSGKPANNAGQIVDLGTGTTVFGQRQRNDPPVDYPTGLTMQFKSMAALGLTPTGNGWCTLETNKGYADSSGVHVVQYAYDNAGKAYKRSGTPDATSWDGAWIFDLDTNVYSGDLNATNGATIGTNLNGQFTSSNSSAFFGNAAITNAMIDTASVNRLIVGTANINDLSVSTLKIADQAVTIPVQGYISGGIGLALGEQTVATATVGATAKGQITIWAGFNYSCVASEKVVVSLYRNGALLTSFTQGLIYNSGYTLGTINIPPYLDTITGAGTYIYTLGVKTTNGNGNASASSRSIVAMATMK